MNRHITHYMLPHSRKLLVREQQNSTGQQWQISNKNWSCFS